MHQTSLRLFPLARARDERSAAAGKQTKTKDSEDGQQEIIALNLMKIVLQWQRRVAARELFSIASLQSVLHRASFLCPLLLHSPEFLLFSQIASLVPRAQVVVLFPLCSLELLSSQITPLVP